MKRKLLFIDRDGTLIVEPEDQQVDSLDKLEFMSGVIIALNALQKAGFCFVMVTNQDGLGTPCFPQENFNPPHEMMLKIFASHGINFESVRICPHFHSDQCECRKPRLGMVLDYLQSQTIDKDNSYVIGDRETDVLLAENLGIGGVLLGNTKYPDWPTVASFLLNKPREASIKRKTKETDIELYVNLDQRDKLVVDTGIEFFDHMLEQLALHGGFTLIAKVNGDNEIDDHHTVEDTAIALGEALNRALSDKWGIGRYGFTLPMDDAFAQVTIDVCGRSYFDFKGGFPRENLGKLSTECVPHFFRSLAFAMQAVFHLQIQGENAHHMVEALFKAVGRALRQAFIRVDNEIPSTKGVL